MKYKKSQLALSIIAVLFNSLIFAKAHQKAGIELYQAACSVCHSEKRAKAIGAPTAFVPAIWQQRKKNAKQEVYKKFNFKNVNDYYLYQIKIGKGLMHHGGLCQESKLTHPKLQCTDKAYLAAINYMSHAKK